MRKWRIASGLAALFGGMAAPATACLLGLLEGLSPFATPTPSATRATATPTPTPSPVTSGGPRTITSCDTNLVDSVRLGADLVASEADCLVPRASGITIDGDGHRITATGHAISWVDQADVTVRNVVSEQGVQIYGPSASRNLVTDSKFGWVGIYRGDDNVVQNSTLGKLTIAGLNNDPAQRETIVGNVISGTLTRNEEKLAEVVTGTDGTLEADGTYHCAAGNHLIADNLIVGTVVSVTTIEPELLYVRCGSGSTISGNTIRSGQRAAGILMRDGADANLIENNDVRIGDGNAGALLIQSGSVGYHQPRDNTFVGNRFRADTGRAFWLEAGATGGNTFLKNLIQSGGGTAETARLTDGPGVTTLFDHNTFYRSAPGTLLVFRSLGPGINWFTSNIFAYAGSLTGVFDFDHLQSFAGYKGDYNDFWNSNGRVTFTLDGGDLNAWKSDSGQDAHSIEANPSFVAPASDDFRIAADSSVIGDGANGTTPGAFGDGRH